MNRHLYLINMSLFKPKEILNRYDEFDIDLHLKLGFKAIFLDIDNTIAIPNSGTCDIEAEKFIKSLISAGYIVLIFSNNNQNRVKKFIRDLNFNYAYHCFKPLPFSYWINCKRYNVKPSETIIMGDQLLTDILGSNLSGCYGIYTKQLQIKDSFITSLNRRVERFIWRFII